MNHGSPVRNERKRKVNNKWRKGKKNPRQQQQGVTDVTCWQGCEVDGHVVVSLLDLMGPTISVRKANKFWSKWTNVLREGALVLVGPHTKNHHHSSGPSPLVRTCAFLTRRFQGLRLWTLSIVGWIYNIIVLVFRLRKLNIYYYYIKLKTISIVKKLCQIFHFFCGILFH